MDRLGRVVIALFAVSLAGSLLFLALDERAIAIGAVVPGAILSMLVFGGHLMTLDDDAPGGWSNPDGEKEIWRSSLSELSAKFAVFVGTWIFAVWLLLA